MVQEVFLPFSKYQALGNDFILLDTRKVKIAKPGELSRILCCRKLGIGADGLILVSPHPSCAARMIFYNPDGSRAGMCGNGIRCVAKYLFDTGWLKQEKAADSTGFCIATDSGPREVSLGPGDIVEANLGTPSFDPASLPAHLAPEEVQDLRFPDLPLPPGLCLSVGNPHCIFFVRDLKNIPINRFGPRVECDPRFPSRINVEFAEPLDKARLTCRVWERGAGETSSCGTGAAAVCVAATLRGLVNARATVCLPGGEIEVRWDRPGPVFIRGPARFVFKGEVPVSRSLLAALSPPKSQLQSPTS